MKNFILDIAKSLRTHTVAALSLLLMLPLGSLLHDLTTLFLTYLAPHLSLQLARDILGIAILIMFVLSACILILYSQNKSLKETITSLKMPSSDEIIFDETACININITKKLLECPKCSKLIKIEQDPGIPYYPKPLPHFSCVSCNYIHRPQDRSGNYLDAYKLRDKLLTYN